MSKTTLLSVSAPGASARRITASARRATGPAPWGTTSARRLLGAVLLLCALPCAALAQGKPAFPSYSPAPEPGRFLALESDYRDPCEVLTPAEEKAVEAVLVRLEEIVRRLPALSPPHGVEARPSRTITHHTA